MKSISKIFALTLASLGLASVAHAQTKISTTGNGSTIQSNGTTINTNGASTTISTPGTGRSRPAARGPVRKARPAAAPIGTQDMAIDGNNEHRTIDCQGNTVTVNGNGNRLILRGTCAKLVLNGNDNSVRWTGAAPAISDLGNKNVTGQVN